MWVAFYHGSCGFSTIVPLWVFHGSNIFSCGYFVGLKFFSWIFVGLKFFLVGIFPVNFFFLWLIAWFKVIQLLPLLRCLGYCMTLRFRLSFGTDKKDWWSNFVKKIIWEWIHPTQVRSHLNAGEISLKWDDFSPCKHFLLVCPTWTGWCYGYYIKKCNLSPEFSSMDVF